MLRASENACRHVTRFGPITLRIIALKCTNLKHHLVDAVFFSLEDNLMCVIILFKGFKSENMCDTIDYCYVN